MKIFISASEEVWSVERGCEKENWNGSVGCEKKDSEMGVKRKMKGKGMIKGVWLLLPAPPYLLVPPPYIFYIPKIPFINISDYIIWKFFSRSRISFWIM